MTEEEHNQASRALDALVTRNRDKARLRIANDMDILALHAVLTPGPVAGWLLDWHLICLDVIDESPVITRPFLVGIREDSGLERMTSFVLGIDLDRGLVQTENSLYALGNRSVVPLTQQHIDFICAVLNSWGVGQFLGVPSFYLFNGEGRLKV